MIGALSGISAGISAISSIYSLAQGAKDRKLADELADQPRPQYNIPQSQLSALRLAELRNLNRELPGEGLYQQRIGEQTATGLRFAQEGATGNAQMLATGAGIVQGGQEAMGNLGIASAQQQLQNEQMLMGQLGTIAGLEDRQWDINQYQPYREDMAAAAALRGSSEQNIYGALEGLGTIIPSTLMASETMKNQAAQTGFMEGFMSDLYGGNKTGALGVDATALGASVASGAAGFKTSTQGQPTGDLPINNQWSPFSDILPFSDKFKY